MELFKLMGSIMVDNKKANDSIQKTNSLAGKVGQTLGGGIKTAAKWGVGLVGAGVAAGGALMGLAAKSSEATDRVDKMSQRLSMSRQAFQEWDYIMSQNGVSIDSFQTGMKKFTKGMDDVIHGSAGMIENFQKLDPALVDLTKSGASQEEVFRATVKAFQKMPEGVEKARLAQELFGKQGQEMLPMLNASKGSIDELTEEAHKLGLVLGDDAIDAGVKLGDTIDAVKKSFGSVVTQIGVKVMPIVQKFLEWILASMPTIQNIFGEVFRVVGNVVDAFINVIQNYLLPIFEAVIDWVKSNWPKISTLFQTTFETVKQILMVFITAFKTAWDVFGENLLVQIQIIWNTISGVISGAMSVIQGVIKFVTSLIHGDWKGAWEGIKQIFSGIWEIMKSTASGAINTIKNSISGAWNGIKALTSLVWGNIKSTTSSVWNGIKNAITSPINAAKDFVKGAIDTIKGLFNFKFHWPKLPMPHFSIRGSMNPLKWLSEGVPKLSVEWYAKGGIFDKPTIFNTPYGLKGVGEAGPEAVTPISALQKMIDWNTGKDTELLERIVELLLLILGKESSVYLDGRKVSKELVEYIDEELNGLRLRRA